MRYAVLLRGINVGGRNKVPMADLRRHLAEDPGGRFTEVSTYIASGNVVLDSELGARDVERCVEELLPRVFRLDSPLVRVLALDPATFADVLEDAPPGFGDDDVTYGRHAFYHRRVAALATRSRVGQVIGSPVYASLTLRNWRTTLALAQRLGLT